MMIKSSDVIEQADAPHGSVFHFGAFPVKGLI